MRSSLIHVVHGQLHGSWSTPRDQTLKYEKPGREGATQITLMLGFCDLYRNTGTDAL